MNSETYKYATIALLIVVIVLGWMLYQRAPAAQGVSDASQSVEDCRIAIASWTAKNKTVASATPEARGELDTIISGCQEKIGQAQ